MPTVWSQDGCTNKLTGKVIDSHDDTPLVGAVIKLNDENRAITSTDGTFTINGLCNEEYLLLITHIDCESLSAPITISSDIHRTFYLEHHTELLQEIIVEGTRKRGELARSEVTVSTQEIERRQGGTFGDLLSDVEGVSLLKTGSTITKPVIQGLHSQRVLTINNGIRMEGQQWGLEHAPAIDPYAVQQVSVIKGAGSVEYGSDGIGGVILVEPAPLKDQYGSSLKTSASLFTNGRGGNVHANYSGKKNILGLPLSFEVQGSLKQYGYLKAPDYYLNNTGVREQNVSARGGYVGDKFGFEAQFSQYNSQLGILTDSHIGNEDDLLEAIERGEPLYDPGFEYELSRPRQKILHEIGLVKGYWHSSLGKVTAEYGRQYNSRAEFDMSDLVPGLQLKTETYTFRSALEYDLMNQLDGKTGIQILSQEYRYDGFYLIPEYQQKGIGAFTFHTYEFSDSFTAEAGIRYDRKRYNYQLPFQEFELIDEEEIHYQSTSATIGEVRNTFNNLITGSAGITYDLSETIRFSSLIGISSRQPLPNELFSDGIHHGTAFWEVGKPDLSVERGTSLQFNTMIDHKGLSANVNAYMNAINNYVYAYPGAESGVVSTIRGAFPTQFTQQSDVQMLGVDYRLSRKLFNDKLQIITRGSFLHVEDRKLNQPLILMPANRMTHSANYFLQNDLRFGLQMQHVLEQKRIPDGRIMQDYAKPPESYSLINLFATYDTKLLNNNLSLTATIDNVLDTNYRDYLDRFRYYVDSPGINAGLRINYQIN